MTNSINFSVIFTERAAKQMEHRLKLSSLCGKSEDTGHFPAGMTEVHFLAFHTCAVSGSPLIFPGTLPEVNGKINEQH